MDANLVQGDSKSALFSPLQTPFDNIALSFSGGGFRAAAFALGTLSYLNKTTFKDGGSSGNTVSLLEKTTFLSSASGGTIATCLYSLHLSEGATFDAFYKKLHSKLQEDLLLQKVLSILNSSVDEDAALWDARTEKRKNFINAFALAYDEMLFSGKTIKDLKANPNGHLEEVCFNTTEMYRGLLFRQSVKVKYDQEEAGFLFGNFVFHLDHKMSENIKLSDALAASSCFPGGFEPIVFPDDFLHGATTAQNYIDSLTYNLQTGGLDELKFIFGDLDIATLKKNRVILMQKLDRKCLTYKRPPSFGFMDGGITDNLGIDSMMRANERRIKGETNFKPFDLMLASDVASGFMDPFCVPVESKSRLGSLTLNRIIVIASVAACCGIGFLILGACNITPLLKYGSIFLGSLLTLVPLIFFCILYKISDLLKGVSADGGGLNLDKNFSPGITQTLLGKLMNTHLSVLSQMIRARLTSVLSLNTDVFLKRVRQLLYNGFFDSAKWSYRVKGNRIYDLSMSNDIARKQSHLPHQPSDKLQKVAQLAVRMGTTLWFDKATQKNHSRECLIACGQFTTCYNLLLYIERLKAENGPYGDLSKKYQDRVDELERSLNTDYLKFMEDPFWLYNELGTEYKLEDFSPINEAMIPFPKQFEGLLEHDAHE